jgi:hypothetical protein
MHLKKKACKRFVCRLLRIFAFALVVPAGIEPATQGFSVLSRHELKAVNQMVTDNNNNKVSGKVSAE